ncbi:LysR family transcriptional regulator [Corticibacter populi]|uniref:LysR family transcriptional regulator n=1 Tax=Corticibacter populi TaxID=1550736 RepID=A0A3M6QST5_9BURK|nr:LysR family transcriptional regulator [Corticibacter populi]RMX05911.1 LysR family transcriptional regulator [Corticibacter populi]RZS30769.1 DNA-binding transcriptional LysR family regulator [Corticibacter populi]
MFQLSQLRCFVEVAAELHFGRAAERLNMTQPPLSRQIRQLEHALGTALLERTRRSVRLTAAGQAFLPEAQDILHRCAAAAGKARRAVQGEAGRVVLGYSAGANFDFLPRAVAAAQHQLPNVDLELREMVTVEQLEALRGGRIDLGLIRLPADLHGLEMRCVMREPMRLVLPRAHPLARRRRLQLQDLHGEPFIMYSAGDGRYFHEMLQALFHEAGVTPRFIQHVRHTHSMLALANAGIGLALVPASTALLRLNNLVVRDLALPDHVRGEMHMVWRRREAIANPSLERMRALFMGLSALD